MYNHTSTLEEKIVLTSNKQRKTFLSPGHDVENFVTYFSIYYGTHCQFRHIILFNIL